MSRLIDADALIEDIVRLPNVGIHWYIDVEAVFKTIDEQPTIDAVPIRRKHQSPAALPDLVCCRECVKKDVCRFYDTHGDDGYCRFGRSENGRYNIQMFSD